MVLKRVLGHYHDGACSQSEIIFIAIHLSRVARAARILIHGLQFEVDFIKEVIGADCRHIEKATFAGGISLKNVIPQSRLQFGSHKEARLSISTEIIV